MQEGQLHALTEVRGASRQAQTRCHTHLQQNKSITDLSMIRIFSKLDVNHVKHEQSAAFRETQLSGSSL